MQRQLYYCEYLQSKDYTHHLSDSNFNFFHTEKTKMLFLRASGMTWGCTPLLFSQELGGQDIDLSHYCHPPYELPSCYSSLHVIKIFLRDCEIVRALGNNKRHEIVRKGDIVVIPANTCHRASWTQEIEFLLMAIKPEFITKVAQNIALTESVRIVPNFACLDELLYGVGLALLKECQNYSTHSIYTQFLLQTVTTHLIRQYSNLVEITTGTVAKQPTEHRLDRALKYINSNLHRHLSLCEIAREINVSKHYFCHLFAMHFGISPHRYILRKRVDKAKLLIRQHPEIKMVDVALDCGFSSQSHFNKQFRNLTGTIPSVYRDNIFSLH